MNYETAQKQNKQKKQTDANNSKRNPGEYWEAMHTAGSLSSVILRRGPLFRKFMAGMSKFRAERIFFL